DMQILQTRQNTPDSPEALATIPVLKLADLDPKIKTIPTEIQSISGTPTLIHDLFTNGIVYLNLAFDLHTLPAAWLPFIPLFGQALVEMGTSRQDYVRLSQRIGRATGGIHPDWLTSNVEKSARSAAYLFLHAKAVTNQAGELFNILNDLLLDVRLDNRERFKQIVLEAKAGLEAGLVPAGHWFVNRRLRASYTEADWASEQMGGVEYLFFLRQLIDQVENHWTSVLDTLEGIRSRLVNRQAMVVNVTLDQKGWSKVQPKLTEFLERLPEGELNLIPWSTTEFAAQEGLTIPAQVNYVGKSLDLYRNGYQFHGSALVIPPYLRGTWLWEKVRVQGGAYGGMCAFDRLSGIFTFFSYRDPNLDQTLTNFDLSSQYLRSLQLSDQELTKAIIGAIGDLDTYQLPDAQGLTALVRYLTGINDEMRQRIRNEVFATTAAHFHQFGEAMAASQAENKIVILGAQDALTAAGQPLTIKKVL
ncbi:MAG TPA: peptidase M16, partial [Anaerolineales bacterium]|nr:peptidase M16 [Anaerolineales bacterium]